MSKIRPLKTLTSTANNGKIENCPVEYNFVLGFSKHTSGKQLDLICSLLNSNGFRYALVHNQKISRSPTLFVRHNDAKAFLKEADKQHILKRKYAQNPLSNSHSPLRTKLKRVLKEKGIENLDPRVKELENMNRFTFNKRKHFLEAPSSPKQKPKRALINKLSSCATIGLTSNGYNKIPQFTGSLTDIVDPELYLSPTRRQESSRPLMEESRETPTPIKEKNTSDTRSLSRGKMKNKKKATFRLPGQIELQTPGETPDNDRQENYEDYVKLFTPSETCRIIWSRLHSIKIDVDDPNFVETFNIKPNQKNSLGRKTFMDVLKDIKLLKYIRPLHTKEVANSVKNITSIKDYFGPGVAVYFEFMWFYVKWLIFPAIIGILLQIFSFDSRPHLNFWINTLYCVVMMIWATLFVLFWERKTSELRIKWGTYGSQFKIYDTRPGFKGEVRVSPITELPELYDSPKRRILTYCASIIAHLPLFILSFTLAIAYLNAKGIVAPTHWIYIESITKLREPGQLLHEFPGAKAVIWIARAFWKFILKRVNHKLSMITTSWENHRTHTSYNNSITTKRFLFGLINTFTNLFYIAFWRLDIDALREELFTLYFIDELKRLAEESFLSYLIKRVIAKKTYRSVTKDGKNLHLDPKKFERGDLDTSDQPSREYIVKKLTEMGRREYSSFKDYYEIIMQFGYITLFAVVFPLSAAISIILNIIEIGSDSFRLRYAMRRPLPEYVDGIGSWAGAIRVMSYLAVVTNSILIANTAEFRNLMAGEEKTEEGGANKMLGIVFLVEHIMLIVIFVIRKIISNQPGWVKVYIKRNLEKGSRLWANIN